MFAPVAPRYNTCQAGLDEVSAAYMLAILELQGISEWMSAARRESEILPEFEPYEDND
jgi:glutathione S-transferase